MCMVGRTVLIHGEARKNKSYRKKYFVLNIGPNYTSPRLDYFSNVDKWNQHKDEITDEISDSLSFRSIDLSNLFFVDNVYRSKQKECGLDLYMEDRHVVLILSSEEVKKKWRELFDNVIYKNGKTKSYPKIEHTLQVGLRLKPKENIDKSIVLQWKGEFRACFLKTSLMFVNKSLESPNFVVQYPFIRQWESKFDGVFRLEIGRAALIGECSLILQLADYSESKAAHTMLTNCIKYFKISRPEPPRLRNSVDQSGERGSSLSYCRKSSLSTAIPAEGTVRSDSSIGFSMDSRSVIGSDSGSMVHSGQGNENSYYMPMKMSRECDSSNPMNRENYVEHISRIYKCPACGYFTKVVTFCSSCTSSSSVNSLRLHCQTEALPNILKNKPHSSIRNKAQSFSEHPRHSSLSIRTPTSKLCFDPNKSELSQTSKSSSKTSTNEMSSGSKIESQNSLSISSNRHDDDIFMELDFDNLPPSKPTGSASSKRSSQCQLQCRHCSASLVHRPISQPPVEQRCSKCSDDMVSLTMVVEESDYCINDWIPRTTSLVKSARPSASNTCTSEYVEVNHNDIAQLDCQYSYCS